MMHVTELLLQYGIAGAALWMMYSITYNHLTTIEDLLTEIRDKLA
ncbi:unnamed protein product [marine sediment metagenome]|uniref:Uncharacterized protein n=1 Tax=marine sediment metagenome TaxID=412755 RepID=X1KLI3_9ZZZZ